MIRCKNVNVSYPNKKDILKNISFNLSPGEIIGVVGPNGSGKSTLIHTLLKLITPYSGTIYLNNNALEKISTQQLATQIAWVSPEFQTPFNFTVEEIVIMGRYPHQHNKLKYSEEDYSIVNKILVECKLESLKTTNINRLSTGEKQRVQLAKAFAQNPTYLLLDEAISHLDLWYEAYFLDILKRRNHETGLSIMMVSHRIDCIFKIADQVICLKNGEIMTSGSPKQVLTSPVISKLFDLKDTSYLTSVTCG